MAKPLIQSIRAERLRKSFGHNRAVTDVSMRLRTGTITVIHGRNGSGKTTLLKLLGLVYRADEGLLYFNDIAVDTRSPARRHIGFVAHDAWVYSDLSALENLKLFEKLYGLRGTSRLPALIERLQLSDFLSQRVGFCSRGQQQRVALARALLHSPALVALDEPMTGLDPETRSSLIALLDEERRNGTIVCLVTHELSAWEGIADHTLHMHKGALMEPT